MFDLMLQKRMKQNKNNDHKYAVLTRINNDNTVMNFF